MKLVGNGSEKAKRQHNPSSGKAKKSTFATCPHGALKQTEGKKKYVCNLSTRCFKTDRYRTADRSRWAHRWAKNVRQPAQWQKWSSLATDPKRPNALTTRPQANRNRCLPVRTARGRKGTCDTGSTAAVLSRPCFALPLRLPLRQGRGVGGFKFDYICTCSEIGVGFLKLTPDTLYTLSCLVMIQALNSGGQIRELLGRRRAEFLEFQSPSLKCSKATVTVWYCVIRDPNLE